VKIEIIWKNNTVKSFIFSLFEIFPSDLDEKNFITILFYLKHIRTGWLLILALFLKLLKLLTLAIIFFIIRMLKYNIFIFLLKMMPT